MASDDKFWGQIDPFLTAIVVILLGGIYAIPRLSNYFGDPELVQFGFFGAAAFLLLFDSYARGKLKIPTVLLKGPLATPMVIVTGLSFFITLWLAIPYLVYGFLTDFLSMDLEYSSSLLALGIISFVGLIWYAKSVFSTIQLTGRGSASAASTPSKKRK